MKNRLLYLIISVSFLPIVVVARDVSLRVVCKETHNPLQAIVRIDATNGYADSLVCDSKGIAMLYLPDSVSDAIMEVSYVRRYPAIINISNLTNNDLGTVELEEQPVALEEFVVYGERHREKAGKHAIIPSIRQVERNFNAAQMLEDMKSDAPELDIDLSRGMLTIAGMSATFQVNGRVVPKDRLIDLSADRVARIEYTTYRDLRYDAPILNIVLKPAQTGGSVSAYTQDAITTPKANSKVNGTFNYKKSEFLVDYNYTYRNSSKEISNEQTEYKAPDFTISRTGVGLPSSTIDQNHRLMMEYSLVPNNNTIFVLSGQASLHRQRGHERLSIAQRDSRDNAQSAYDSWNNRHYWRTPFSLGAFYKRKSGNKVLELSSSVSRSHGVYERQLMYSDGYDFQSNSENNGTSAKVDVDYSAPLRTNLNFNVGTYYLYNESSSELVQDGLSEADTKLTKHEVYAYGSLMWENRGFALSGGPGIKYVYLDNGYEREKYVRWKGQISASQRVGRNFRISYNMSVDPDFPSRADYSTVVQRINDYSVRVGNPDVTTGFSVRQSLRFNLNLNRLRISPSVNYTYGYHPILETWTYDTAEEYFVNSVANGKYSQNLYAELNVTMVDIFNKINLTTYVGAAAFRVVSPEFRASKTSAFLGFNATAYLGPCNISVRYDPIKEYQYSGSSYIKNFAFNSVKVNYNYKNFQFGLTWQNPFSHQANLMRTWSLSKVHPSYSEYCIKDFNNCVLVSVQYRIGMGQRLKKMSISTNKISTEDVIKAY